MTELAESVLANGAAVTAGLIYLANVGSGGTLKVVKCAANGLVSDLKTATRRRLVHKVDCHKRMGGFPVPGQQNDGIFLD